MFPICGTKPVQTTGLQVKIYSRFGNNARGKHWRRVTSTRTKETENRFGYHLYNLFTKQITTENRAIKFALRRINLILPAFAYCPTCGSSATLTEINAYRRNKKIHENTNSASRLTDYAFMKVFGVTDLLEHDNCINFFFLCLKFYLHRCKFQQINPNFLSFLNLVKIKRNSEYKIAESKGTLSFSLAQSVRSRTVNLSIGCIDRPRSSPTRSWVCENYIFYEGANCSR